MSRRYVFLCCIMFILYGQALLYLDEVAFLGTAFSLIRAILFVFAMALFIRKFSLSKLEILLGIYAAVLLSITILKGGDIVVFTSHFMNVATLWVLFKIYFKGDPAFFLKCSSVVLSSFVYINFFLTIAFPLGIFSVGRFLLGGNYNQMGATLLLTMVINAVYCQLKGGYNLNMFLLAIISISTVLFVGSMTSSVSLTILIIFMLLSKYRVSRLILTIFFILVLAANIGLLILQVSIEDSQYIAYFIENILGKDTSFSGRAAIWTEAIYMIERSYYFGYGMRSVDWFDFHFNALTPHNFFISILLKGGAVLFLIFSALIYHVVRKANKYKTCAVNILQFGSCALLLMMTMETYSIFIIFFLTFMVYFSDIISGMFNIGEEYEE